MVDLSKTYTVKEVAEVLRLHVDSIRRYVKEGKLKSFCFGRKFLIKGETLPILLTIILSKKRFGTPYKKKPNR